MGCASAWRVVSPLRYAGVAAVAVRPMASAYFKYVSTDAMTTRASIDRISLKYTFAQASIYDTLVENAVNHLLSCSNCQLICSLV